MSASMDLVGAGSGVDAGLGVGTVTGAHAGRRDGRGAAEMRELSVTQGPLSLADGSANVQVGGSVVLAAVYGPMETSVPKQEASRCAITVWIRDGAESRVDGGGGEDALRDLLRTTVLCALHPRKNVCVCAHLLSSDGGVRAAIVNATVLALMDAGVPLVTVPVAACVALSNDAVIADPNDVEEAEADAVLTFTFSTSDGKLSRDFAAIHTIGDCGGVEQFNRAVDVAHSLAEHTLSFFKLSMERKLNLPRAW